MCGYGCCGLRHGCRRPQAIVGGSVAELLSRIDQVGLPEVVELDNALSAGRAENPAQRFAAFDDVDPHASSGVRRGVRAGGDGGFSVVSSAITLNGTGNAPLQYVGDGAPVPPDLSYKNILVHTYTVAQVQRALQPYGAINNEPEF